MHVIVPLLLGYAAFVSQRHNCKFTMLGQELQGLLWFSPGTALLLCSQQLSCLVLQQHDGLQQQHLHFAGIRQAMFMQACAAFRPHCLPHCSKISSGLLHIALAESQAEADSLTEICSFSSPGFCMQFDDKLFVWSMEHAGSMPCGLHESICVKKGVFIGDSHFGGYSSCWWTSREAIHLIAEAAVDQAAL